MPKKKAKAVFVDGPSFSFMRPILGIDHVKYHVLFKILTEEIGTASKIHPKPLWTISSNVPYPQSLAKRFESAGFDAFITSTINGADDQLIIDTIRKLKPSEVSDIVIVTADQDYAPVLSEKAKKGIKIWWVATRGLDHEGRSMLSRSLDPLFETEFNFVELANFKERIIQTPWTHRERPVPAAEPAHQITPPTALPDAIVPVEPDAPIQPEPESPLTRVVKITMEMTVTARRTPEILHSIGSLMGNMQRLDGVVRIKTTTEVE